VASIFIYRRFPKTYPAGALASLTANAMEAAGADVFSISYDGRSWYLWAKVPEGFDGVAMDKLIDASIAKGLTTKEARGQWLKEQSVKASTVAPQPTITEQHDV
jgi:hypothetical protein